MAIQKRKRYASVLEKECVACGTCILVCPKFAITVPRGIYAEVNTDICIGCGLCKKACPASVIEMITNLAEEEINKNEKERMV